MVFRGGNGGVPLQDMLSVDFVVELPLSSGHDAVMTVVDSVSKRAHFIPTHTTVTAEGAARLFLHQVWKLHDLLTCVVSDRRPQFVARFTKELYCLLGIKLAPPWPGILKPMDRWSASTRN